MKLRFKLPMAPVTALEYRAKLQAANLLLVLVRPVVLEGDGG